MVAHDAALKRSVVLQVLPVPGDERRVFLQRTASADTRAQLRQMHRLPLDLETAKARQRANAQRRQIAPGTVEIEPEIEFLERRRLRRGRQGARGLGAKFSQIDHHADVRALHDLGFRLM